MCCSFLCASLRRVWLLSLQHSFRNVYVWIRSPWVFSLPGWTVPVLWASPNMRDTLHHLRGFHWTCSIISMSSLCWRAHSRSHYPDVSLQCWAEHWGKITFFSLLARFQYTPLSTYSTWISLAGLHRCYQRQHQKCNKSQGRQHPLLFPILWATHLVEGCQAG